MLFKKCLDWLLATVLTLLVMTVVLVAVFGFIRVCVVYFPYVIGGITLVIVLMLLGLAVHHTHEDFFRDW